MDYGAENGSKLSRHAIQDKLERYKVKNKKPQMTRECLIDFVGSEYGFSMTQL